MEPSEEGEAPAATRRRWGSKTPKDAEEVCGRAATRRRAASTPASLTTAVIDGCGAAAKEAAAARQRRAARRQSPPITPSPRGDDDDALRDRCRALEAEVGRLKAAQEVWDGQWKDYEHRAQQRSRAAANQRGGEPSSERRQPTADSARTAAENNAAPRDRPPASALEVRAAAADTRCDAVAAAAAATIRNVEARWAASIERNAMQQSREREAAAAVFVDTIRRREARAARADAAPPPAGASASSPRASELSASALVARAVADGVERERWVLFFMLFLQFYVLVAVCDAARTRIPIPRPRRRVAGVYFAELVIGFIVCVVIEVLTLPLFVRASRSFGCLTAKRAPREPVEARRAIELV